MRLAQKCRLHSNPGHAAASRTSILPVTAAEMRAVRSSLRRLMTSRTLAMRASIWAVSWSRKEANAVCSSFKRHGHQELSGVIVV